MKKLVNLRCYVAVGKDELADTSIWNHIRYVEVGETNSTEYILETWEEAVAAVQDNGIRNAEMNRTLFGNKPIIEIGWGDLYRCKTQMREKSFKPIHVKWMWEDVDKAYSLKSLADLLPADQFCEYLKDRGINSCPMIN